MISMTELERMFLRCPEVDISEYQEALYEEFPQMDHNFSSEYAKMEIRLCLLYIYIEIQKKRRTKP